MVMFRILPDGISTLAGESSIYIEAPDDEVLASVLRHTPCNWTPLEVDSRSTTRPEIRFQLPQQATELRQLVSEWMRAKQEHQAEQDLMAGHPGLAEHEKFKPANEPFLSVEDYDNRQARREARD